MSATACSTLEPAYLEDTERRHPDGIAVDPVASPPEPLESADTTAGVAALKTPLGLGSARSTVGAFFEAIANEDGLRVQQLLADQALFSNPSNGQSEHAYGAFLRRFARLDYTGLVGLSFWEETSVLQGDEAIAFLAERRQQVPVRRAGRPRMRAPLTPVEADVVFRVSVPIRRTAATTLLGEELVLALRAEGGRYQISQIMEDFTLPP